MKVLHINQSDLTGGAAIGVDRLHQGLLAQGIDSRFLVDIVTSSSDRVSSIPNRTRLDYILYRITRRLGFNDLHLISTFQIKEHPFYQTADLIHFHNLHSGYFNYLALPELTKEKPAIVTLHDMWGITGHCSYSLDCDRYITGCGKCPYPNSYPPIQRDNTAIEWKLKKWAYLNSNIKFVTTTSQWLKAQIGKSMLQNLPIKQIPYGINPNIYQPLPKEKCRELLQIPFDKKVLMFGAQNLTDPRKGGDLLQKSLENLPDTIKKNTIVIILGYGGEAMTQKLGLSSINLGFVASDHLKAIAYSAADLFLFPTRGDAFGLVAQEAIACGTPTIAFNVGGVSDIVRPHQTGYLAKDVTDFTNAIVKLLTDSTEWEQLSQSGRAVIIKEYSLEAIALKYLELYQSCF